MYSMNFYNKKVNQIFALVILCLLITLCFISWFGRVTFGHGLGDLFYIWFLFGLTTIHLLSFLINRNSFKYLVVTNIIVSSLTVYFMLKATIFRGPEYSWKGDFFYIPCRTEIQIESDDVEVISMCSMVYDSKFSAIWDGDKMLVIDGNIQIPPNLIEHVSLPIKSVYIEPGYWEKVGDEEIIREYKFDSDTLIRDKKYTLSGELIRILDTKPVMEVRLLSN